MTKTHVTWKKYIDSIKKVAEYFQNQRFDVIIGLTRGGLIPAVLLSHELNIPMMPFNPHVLHTNGEPRENIELCISPSVIREILIIDDISDTGKTFKKTAEFFTKKGFNVTTASVYINKTTTVFKPNFALYDSHKKWVVFPYEKE